MWPTLPRELMPDILVYLDPDWAAALSRTSKDLRRLLYKFYTKNARLLIQGEWRHRLCKRARESIPAQISPTPRALASMVHRRCARCDKRLLGKFHCMGIIIHDICLKDLLLNVYYLQKDFGLGKDTIQTLPQFSCEGFPHGVYTRVWKTGSRGIVPYEWTAHHLVHRTKTSTRKWNKKRYPYLD